MIGTEPSLSTHRFEKRGRNYLSLLRCPLDQSTLVAIDKTTLVSEENPDHIYHIHQGIIHLLTSEQDQFLTARSAPKIQAYQNQGIQPPLSEDFKSLPQTPLPNATPIYWQQRAYATAALWRVLERIRHAEGHLPVGPIGNAVEFTDGMGWLGYGLDIAGYTTIVLGEDKSSYGLAAYPYARYQRVYSSFETVPLASNIFDIVVFSFSLSINHNPERILKNAIQLLAPQGHLIVMFDNLGNTPQTLPALVINVLHEEKLHIERERMRPMSGGFARKMLERLQRRVPNIPALVIGKRSTKNP
jgi:SAM-dependent methyltransferase